LLEVDDHLLSLSSKNRRSSSEFSDIIHDFRKDIDEDKYDNSYEDNIEQCDSDIRRSIFRSKSMSSIFFSMLSPVMDLMCNHFARFEKNIGTNKYNEKEGNKIKE